jgi:hypothetical protein
MARKFLYLIALLTVLVIAALFALRIWSRELTEFAFVPRSEFVEQATLAPNAYEDPSMWFSRPGIGDDDPSRWQPSAAAPEAGDQTTQEASSTPTPSPTPALAAKAPPFAVFFIHPTSYLNRAQWNAPLDDRESQERARIFLRGMASPFNAASEIWAPRYRQATFGAFLTDAPEAQKALDVAYHDVEQAFEFFLSSIDEKMPIVLAGHSQGALHLTRLLKERVAGTPLAKRIIAVYPIGWPISVEHDLPYLGMPACETSEQTGCIITWSSFAEPADPAMVMDRYSESLGYDGQKRGNSPILCTNPLTSSLGGEAPASANLGTLVPDNDLKNGEIVKGMVPARCAPSGLLLIGEPPKMGPYVLPGNNYHVYDIPLFWRNLEADVGKRVETWAGHH